MVGVGRIREEESVKSSNPRLHDIPQDLATGDRLHGGNHL